MIDQKECHKTLDKIKAPSSGVKALDELLDLPHLNVLLCYVLTHLGKDVCELLEKLETHKGDENRALLTRTCLIRSEAGKEKLHRHFGKLWLISDFFHHEHLQKAQS